MPNKPVTGLGRKIHGFTALLGKIWVKQEKDIFHCHSCFLKK
jgi:hypothetical protein